MLAILPFATGCATRAPSACPVQTHARAAKVFFATDRRQQTLKGVLPTCAWCKRIRDADNHWHQFESYISNRSEAEFSHGICPECAMRNFGEFLK